MLYTIRIDLLEDVEERFKLFIDKYQTDFSRLLISREISKKTEKPHFQGIMDIDEMLIKKVRNDIVRNVLKGYVSKGKYSMSTVDNEEAYTTYIMKDGDIVYNINYTDEQLDYYRNQVIEYQQIQKAKKVVPRGVKVLEWCKKHEDEFLRVGQPDVTSRYYDPEAPEQYVLDRAKLIRVIIRHFSEETLKFRSFLIEEYFNLVEHHYVPRRTENRLVNEILTRLQIEYGSNPCIE